MIKSILVLVCIVVVLTVSWPYIQTIFPDTTDSIPRAILNDVETMGEQMEELAETVIQDAASISTDGIGGALDMATSRISDGIEGAADFTHNITESIP